MENYVDYAVEKAFEMLSIDSPTGYTEGCAKVALEKFQELGFKAERTKKGGVLVDLGGKDEENGLVIMAHLDTLGCMVAEVKANGRLRLTNLGGLHAKGTEGENVLIYTRDGKKVEGTIQIPNPSVHVNRKFEDTERNWDTYECVIDEDVRNAEDVRKLGIDVGDLVCLETRSRVTSSGYIKSRFLDDKLCVGILYGLAKYIKDKAIVLDRHTYLHLTVYEEVGHGGSSSIPCGVTEGLSVDMGCVGDGLQGSERKVSICVKDTSGPYSYEMTDKLVKAARREGADYALDVYPNYGSDVETTLRAGYDIRHGLIGPGVFASHCYERSHKEGVRNTLLVLKGYLGI